MVSREQGDANLTMMLRKYDGQKDKKIQRIIIRLAMVLNKKGVAGNLKNIDNGRCPHIVIEVGDEKFSAVYFASRREWQVMDGYGKNSTTAWHFKQYAHVARFLESGCTDEHEVMHVRKM